MDTHMKRNRTTEAQKRRRFEDGEHRGTWMEGEGTIMIREQYSRSDHVGDARQ
jgi:hypothetical protein